MTETVGGPLVPRPGAAEPGLVPTGSALPGPALRAIRERPAAGLSRRALLRGSLAAGVGLLVAEWAAGSLGFAWSALRLTPLAVRVGTLDDLVAMHPLLPVREGFPGYVPAAKAFVILLDPTAGVFRAGTDPTGDGTALNVRALSQVCPHLGCRPNPCVEDFWFHCPCHQSRYDRTGIKIAGERYGPAARSMDRFAISVDADGVLTVDTSRLTLGPLPIALGQPGVIPPKVEDGCG
jgi:nitrite reductase/ring-hydroxylating ferredoxin subunit